MACDSNRDANFSDCGKISATKWGKYNCSPAIHCARMACLSLNFSAAPKLYEASALIIVNAYFSSEIVIMHGY